MTKSFNNKNYNKNNTTLKKVDERTSQGSGGTNPNIDHGPNNPQSEEANNNMHITNAGNPITQIKDSNFTNISSTLTNFNNEWEHFGFGSGATGEAFIDYSKIAVTKSLGANWSEEIKEYAAQYNKHHPFVAETHDPIDAYYKGNKYSSGGELKKIQDREASNLVLIDRNASNFIQNPDFTYDVIAAHVTSILAKQYEQFNNVEAITENVKSFKNDRQGLLNYLQSLKNEIVDSSNMEFGDDTTVDDYFNLLIKTRDKVEKTKQTYKQPVIKEIEELFAEQLDSVFVDLDHLRDQDEKALFSLEKDMAVEYKIQLVDTIQNGDFTTIDGFFKLKNDIREIVYNAAPQFKAESLDGENAALGIPENNDKLVNNLTQLIIDNVGGVRTYINYNHIDEDKKEKIQSKLNDNPNTLTREEVQHGYDTTKAQDGYQNYDESEMFALKENGLAKKFAALSEFRSQLMFNMQLANMIVRDNSNFEYLRCRGLESKICNFYDDQLVKNNMDKKKTKADVHELLQETLKEDSFKEEVSDHIYQKYQDYADNLMKDDYNFSVTEFRLLSINTATEEMKKSWDMLLADSENNIYSLENKIHEIREQVRKWDHNWFDDEAGWSLEMKNQILSNMVFAYITNDSCIKLKAHTVANNGDPKLVELSNSVKKMVAYDPKKSEQWIAQGKGPDVDNLEEALGIQRGGWLYKNTINKVKEFNLQKTELADMQNLTNMLIQMNQNKLSKDEALNMSEKILSSSSDPSTVLGMKAAKNMLTHEPTEDTKDMYISAHTKESIREVEGAFKFAELARLSKEANSTKFFGGLKSAMSLDRCISDCISPNTHMDTVSSMATNCIDKHIDNLKRESDQIEQMILNSNSLSGANPFSILLLFYAQMQKDRAFQAEVSMHERIKKLTELTTAINGVDDIGKSHARYVNIKTEQDGGIGFTVANDKYLFKTKKDLQEEKLLFDLVNGKKRDAIHKFNLFKSNENSITKDMSTSEKVEHFKKMIGKGEADLVNVYIDVQKGNIDSQKFDLKMKQLNEERKHQLYKLFESTLELNKDNKVEEFKNNLISTFEEYDENKANELRDTLESIKDIKDMKEYVANLDFSSLPLKEGQTSRDLEQLKISFLEKVDGELAEIDESLSKFQEIDKASDLSEKLNILDKMFSYLDESQQALFREYSLVNVQDAKAKNGLNVLTIHSEEQSLLKRLEQYFEDQLKNNLDAETKNDYQNYLNDIEKNISRVSGYTKEDLGRKMLRVKNLVGGVKKGDVGKAFEMLTEDTKTENLSNILNDQGHRINHGVGMAM